MVLHLDADEHRLPLRRHRTRGCLLKRKEKLTRQQRYRLRELLRYDLLTVRAYLKVQALHLLWEYRSPVWAGRFLDAWCRDVMSSRIEPLKEVARSLRQHRALIELARGQGGSTSPGSWRG
jgi:transposase